MKVAVAGQMHCGSSMLLPVTGKRPNPFAQVSNHELLVTLDTPGER